MLRNNTHSRKKNNRNTSATKTRYSTVPRISHTSGPVPVTVASESGPPYAKNECTGRLRTESMPRCHSICGADENVDSDYRIAESSRQQAAPGDETLRPTAADIWFQGHIVSPENAPGKQRAAQLIEDRVDFRGIGGPTCGEGPGSQVQEKDKCGKPECSLQVAFSELRAEVFAIDVLHGKENTVARFADVVYAAHIGMRDLVEQRRDFRVKARQAIGVTGKGFGEELQRNGLS